MSLNRKLFSKSASDAVCNSESLEPFGEEASFNKNVAIYQFEDNVNDSSGNGHTAALDGASYDSSGKFGKALSFDGTNDKLDLPDNILPTNSTSSSSATCWIKTSAANHGTMDCILNAFTDDSSKPGWALFRESNQTYLRLVNYHLGGGTGADDGTTAINDGNWHFVAVVFDYTAGTLKCYLDGALECSVTGFTPTRSDAFTDRASIGYQDLVSGATRFYDGLIDQVRIYSKALNTEEISILYVDETTSTASSTTIIPGTSCIAYYPLDYDASDKSTNWDAESSNNVEFVQNGKINYAARFNGSDSYIDLPDDTAVLNRPNNYSVSAWVFFDSLTDYDTIFAFQSLTRTYLDVRADGMLEFWDGTMCDGSAGDVTTGQWYHLTVTKSSTAGKVIYRNGTALVTESGQTADSQAESLNGLNRIGQYASGSTPAFTLDGRICEVRIFNKALSASEVSTLAGLTACTQTCTTDTTNFIATNAAYYPFDNSANGQTGANPTTTSNLTYKAGRFGAAVDFNGSNSVWQSTNQIIDSQSNFTISMWFKLDAYNTSGSYLWTSYATGDCGISFNSKAPYDRYLSFHKYNNTQSPVYESIDAEEVTILGQWYHVCGTFNTTTGMAFYINGVLIGTDSTTWLPQDHGAYSDSIGCYGYTPATTAPRAFFDGQIDQFRAYQSTLSASNVQDLYDTEFQCYITKDASNPFGSGEVAFFKFENNLTDSTGSYAADASSVAYTTTDPAFGTYSLSFNDSSNYIDFGTSGKIPVVGVSYWVKMNAAGHNTRDTLVFSEAASSTHFGCVRWGSNDAASSWYAGGTAWTYYGTDWDMTGRWHHVYHDKDLNVYLNGVQINSGSVGATSQDIRYIGKWPTGVADYYMNGYMDQLRVFSTALTGEQVWKLYAERNN